MVFKYYPPRRAPPFRFDQRGLGTLPSATVCKNHRFTDASPRTSWRSPKMARGESAVLANALRVQQTHRQNPFWFIARADGRSLKGGAAVHTRLRQCADPLVVCVPPGNDRPHRACFVQTQSAGMISCQTLCFFLPRLVGPFGCGGPNTRTDNQSCKPKAVSIAILVGYDRFGARRLRSMRARSCRADGIEEASAEEQELSCRVPSRLPIDSFSRVE